MFRFHIVLPPPHEKTAVEHSTDEDCGHVKTFLLSSDDVDLSFCKPSSVIIYGREYPVRSWKWVLQTIFSFVHYSVSPFYPHLHKSQNGKMRIISDSKNDYRSPVFIAPGIWLETNFSANDALKQCKKLLLGSHNVDLSQIAITVESKESVYTLPPTETPRACEPKAQKVNLSPFKEDIQNHYLNGFDFSQNAIRLIESRCGRFTNEAQTLLKEEMFKRNDGLYFFPDIITPLSVQKEIISKADIFLEQYSFFALSNLLEQTQFQYIESPDDKNSFLKFILSKNNPTLQFASRGQRCTCARAGVTLLLEKGKTYSSIHVLLNNRQDAIPLSEILDTFPNLNESVVKEILEDFNHDIVLDNNGEESLKLIEFYYLPEDFQSQILEALENAEQTSSPATIAFFATIFDAKNNCDFRYDFALENDDAFQEVIALSYNAIPNLPKRSWKGKRFILEDASSNDEQGGVVQAFLANYKSTTNDPVFDEKDFFNFARNSWGLCANNDLLIGYLSKSKEPYRLLRLNRERWILESDFLDNSNWSEEISMKIAELLSYRLGFRPYLPIFHIPESFFEELPSLQLFSSTLNWNHYLLASLANKFIDGVKTENTDISHYLITDYLYPIDVVIESKNNGSLRYVLETLNNSGEAFNTVDDVFNRLKTDQIRARLSKNVREIIKEVMGIE